MGQRLQVYIRLHNPVQALREKLKALKKNNAGQDDFCQLTAQIKKYKQAFGNGPVTTIVYHHQWCYGRSALIAVYNIMNVCINASEASNPFTKECGLVGDEFISAITYLLSWFTCKLSALISRNGFENFHLLNFSEPSIRNDFFIGDNNDGIIIIDTIDNGYCFMNIGEGDSTISQLPLLQPLNAEQYVRAYYPEHKNDSITIRLPENNSEHDTFYINNSRINRLFLKPFTQYRMLNFDEVKNMFPFCYKKHNTNTDHHV